MKTELDILDEKWAVRIMNPRKDIGTDLTFYGVIKNYPENTFARWLKERTRKEYARYLNKVILPNMENHNSKSISEYTYDDFEQVIERIGAKYNYSDSTLQTFRRIIYQVVHVASAFGLCKNVLRNSCFCCTRNRTRL